MTIITMYNKLFITIAILVLSVFCISCSTEFHNEEFTQELSQDIHVDHRDIYAQFESVLTVNYIEVAIKKIEHFCFKDIRKDFMEETAEMFEGYIVSYDKQPTSEID
ncbi:hypothetical protein [Flammeovirga sp. SubArs3]|uniref:hypothetical protein n=1 Tax=Flammeovirga sp. SubArs3 TaxID=2995316 RepID=UPI00248D0E88|nr:hypothetical protein [Flammeovirga sp. SubArs3]